MTTGRINQVTILGLWSPEGPRPTAGVSPAAEQFTVVGGRLERYLSTYGPQSLGYDGFPRAIQLPPLCSPRDGPRYHYVLAPGAGHRVSHLALRRRIPSAGHARGGYRPRLTPECLVN